jgi:hypothetical protein
LNILVLWDKNTREWNRAPGSGMDITGGLNRIDYTIIRLKEIQSLAAWHQYPDDQEWSGSLAASIESIACTQVEPHSII